MRLLRSYAGLPLQQAALALVTVVLTKACIALLVLTSSCSGGGKEEASSSGNTSGVDTAIAAGTSVVWNFDTAPLGQPPEFTLERTGPGPSGRWIVQTANDAPSPPNVLAQDDANRTDGRFPVAVADSPSFGDVRVSVRCKMIGGSVDQACGIVWRYRDANNYYVARANALEDNVRFYYVRNGERHQIKGWNGTVQPGVWHELRADIRGERVEIYFDGSKVIDARDTRFTTPGKVGVWTKADSRTLFDDLSAVPLAAR